MYGNTYIWKYVQIIELNLVRKHNKYNLVYYLTLLVICLQQIISVLLLVFWKFSETVLKYIVYWKHWISKVILLKFSLEWKRNGDARAKK